MKKIFIAGAGLVVRPLVRYLLDRPGYHLEVADMEPERAAGIIGGHVRATALTLDIQDPAALRRRIAAADLVISMLPYVHHPKLGALCVEFGKPMVTASYISPAMKALDEGARRRGVILLNEIGLDPGLDHMEAMRIIRDVKSEGGTVLGFVSYCGGLPAPEAGANPFGYKFSWSPKGVLLAGRNPARYLEDGRTVVIPAERLFDSAKIVSISGLGDFEAYPNRDSLPYAESYGIPETKTMLRGTLRYPGWCGILKKLGRLGLLDESERDFSGMTYAGLIRELTHASGGEDPKKALAKALKIDPDSAFVAALAWLGFLEEKKIPARRSTALDVLVALMTERMRYAEEERDMVILRHEFLIGRTDGKKEKIISTLIEFGIPGGDSSMSRTVGLPAAIGARCILEGKIRLTGVQAPLDSGIFEPILDELKSFGIEFKQERRILD